MNAIGQNLKDLVRYIEDEGEPLSQLTPMLEKTKYFLCIFSIALCFGIASESYAQPFLPRELGGAALVLDSRSVPSRNIMIYVPTTLTTSYQLLLPGVPPPGPLSALVSDVNGNMAWASGGTATLPALPPNNIWVGNSLSVATPYAPTVPGAILTLSPSSVPTWSTTIPVNTTISVSQLTTGTLQSGVVFNVGGGSSITLTGGTNTSNLVVGAGPGNFAGTVAIPINSVVMTVPYTPIQAGAAVVLDIIDSPNQGILPYLQTIIPGTGFTVAFSAGYPTATGKVHYHIINP